MGRRRPAAADQRVRKMIETEEEGLLLEALDRLRAVRNEEDGVVGETEDLEGAMAATSISTPGAAAGAGTTRAAAVAAAAPAADAHIPDQEVTSTHGATEVDGGGDVAPMDVAPPSGAAAVLGVSADEMEKRKLAAAAIFAASRAAKELGAAKKIEAAVEAEELAAVQAAIKGRRGGGDSDDEGGDGGDGGGGTGGEAGESRKRTAESATGRGWDPATSKAPAAKRARTTVDLAMLTKDLAPLEELREVTECFSIRRKDQDTRCHGVNHEDNRLASVIDESRMQGAGFCDDEIITGTWDQKTLLDGLFDSDLGKVYYAIRDTLFPTEEVQRFWNRAGDKLSDVHDACDIFDGIEPGFAFLDLCAGPGAFSQFMLEMGPGAETGLIPQGFGVTLQDENASNFYPQLLDNPAYTVIHGSDGSGDITRPKVVRSVVEQVRGHMSLVVADGSFKVATDRTGAHLENLQELFLGRLVLAQVVIGIQALRPGGHLCLKLYDTFSALTCSLIYVVSALFEDTQIVKPARCRIVNSERFLFCRSLIAEASVVDKTARILSEFHRRCNEDFTPMSVVPIDEMKGDTEFVESLREASSAISSNQIRALSLVIEEVNRVLDATPALREPGRVLVDSERTRKRKAAAAAAAAAANPAPLPEPVDYEPVPLDGGVPLGSAPTWDDFNI